VELKKVGIKFVENNSHIVSVVIGDAAKARAVSQRLLDEFNIYVQHINFPTVAKGDERLRITVTPLHVEEMVGELVRGLSKII
jgi:5-aminolevulinate synthase